MDLKAVEENAGTIPLQTIDNLFRMWQRDETDIETVTQILRCLRAALALNARGEVRDHFVEEHGEEFLCLAGGIILWDSPHQFDYDMLPDLVEVRCLLQVS